jgi:hypothetical protein
VAPPDLSEQHPAFFTALGLCITDWAYFERELFRLCDFALGADRKRASIVFYRTPNIESRISLTDDLVKSQAFAKADAGQWTTIRNDVRKLLEFRNHIAHQPVTYGGSKPMRIIRSSIPGKSRVEGEYDPQFWVYLNNDEKLRGRERKYHKVGLDDLKKHRETLDAITRELRALVERVKTARLTQPG